MPTVLREDGFEVVINTHDHEPPHVHVYKGGELVIIDLADGALHSIYMKARNLRQARAIVEEHREFLLAEWERIGPIA
jgi:hypothetical protein